LVNLADYWPTHPILAAMGQNWPTPPIGQFGATDQKKIHKSLFPANPVKTPFQINVT
jgi:hypothetical protein